MVAMQNYDRTPKGLNSAVNRLNAQSPYDAVLIADTGKSAAGVAPLIRKGSSAGAKILGNITVGENCRIGPDVVASDMEIGRDCTVVTYGAMVSKAI